MTMENFDDQHAKTRLLLALWDLGGLESAVKKGDLTQRVVKTKEKAGDYTAYLDALAELGAIALTNKVGGAIEKTTKIGTLISLTEVGKLALAKGLGNAGFQFGGNQVGSRVANALLKWIREGGVEGIGVSGEAIAPKISAYEEFKVVALEVYEQLNRDYNYDKLVPIYRMRRAIGDRVTRSQFSDWMLEMQANDILQLQEGSVEDSAPEKIEDSITTELSGLRCYAKLLDF